MYWLWSFHLPGQGLLGAFHRMLPEQKCITFALAALIFLNQPQSVFYRNSLYYYQGQIAELILYCFSIAAFLTYWLVVIDVMSKQNPIFSSFSKGFWIYKSLFFALFFAAHLLRLSHVLGYARQETGAQNSQSDPDFFEKLGGLYFVRYSWLLCDFPELLTLLWQLFFSFMAIIWALWWIKSVRKCSRNLKTLPYLSTRYRQVVVAIAFSIHFFRSMIFLKLHETLYAAVLFVLRLAQYLAWSIHDDIKRVRSDAAPVKIHIRVFS
jgi:hypothetical protein